MSDGAGDTEHVGLLTRTGGLMFVAGLILVVVALFTLNLTVRTLTFWWYQSEYVRTELEVTAIGHGEDPLLFGVVKATGEEVHTSIFPTEVYRYDSPSDATGTRKSADEIRGLVVPIWYSPHRRSLLGDPRIYYVSEYGTLPGARLALVTTAINAAIGWLGVACLRGGLRRRRPEPPSRARGRGSREASSRRRSRREHRTPR